MKAAELRASGVEPWSDSYYVRRTSEAQGCEIVFVDVVTCIGRPSPWWLRLRSRLRPGRFNRQLARPTS